MSKLVAPHGGGSLKPLLLNEGDRNNALAKAEKLKKIPMSSREISDVLMFSMGAYTPLQGFMGASDWYGTCKNMQLESGVFWPIPVTLSAEASMAASIKEKENINSVIKWHDGPKQKFSQ